MLDAEAIQSAVKRMVAAASGPAGDPVRFVRARHGGEGRTWTFW